MILSVLLIENAFLKIETTAFTCLIFTQYLMLLTEVYHKKFIQVKSSSHSHGIHGYFIAYRLHDDFIFL